MVGISVFAALIKSRGDSQACLVVAELSGIRRKSLGAFFVFTNLLLRWHARVGTFRVHGSNSVVKSETLQIKN